MKVRLAALALAAAVASPAAACNIELVLAMDVSRSVVNAEYNLQIGGMAQALRHPDVVDAIANTPGGVMATVTQWSGPNDQSQALAWHHLSTQQSTEAFAGAVGTIKREFFGAYTAVGEALLHADKVAAANPRPCSRRVIDISGDGASNRGRDAAEVSAFLASRGVTINALVILGARPNPVDFYQTNVVRGPASFLEIANSFNDYATAMTRKLVRELSPAVVMR